MTRSPQRGTGSQFRRPLITAAVLFGGMAVLSFLSRRPGDFEAGLVPGVVGAALVALVVVIELTGRRFIRKRRTSDDQAPSFEKDE